MKALLILAPSGKVLAALGKDEIVGEIAVLASQLKRHLE